MSRNINSKLALAAVRSRIGLEEALVIGVFLTLALVTLFVPDATAQQWTDNGIYLAIIFLLPAIYILGLLLAKGDYQRTTDIFLIGGILLLTWELAFTKLALGDPLLFPGPAQVFAVFGTDQEVMIKGVISSFTILFAGYFLALVVAVPVALWVGWRKRAYNVAYPIAKAISPIPATVYLPYSIVLLPTFSSASIFVIFIGAFWPIFVNTVYGVFNIDHRIINSARALGLKERIMLVKVILPAALPAVFSGALIALILSFITLTVAEMIAATSGLGWYIEYQHQFANYDKVIAGMMLMAACVIAVMWIFDRVQAYSLRWQRRE